uniref:Putative methyltransferase n=1 Tax=viral metagenome TaxID=1070528 RepID=A0A6H1ZID1_9ZZZZ
MKYFDSFAGVAGFSLGIERAYANLQPKDEQLQMESDLSESDSELLQRTALCIGFSEVNKYASQVLRYRYPNIKNYGDITQIDWSTVPDFDLFVGGSPCQDLSVAGKRKGLEGERSGLFAEYIRALEEKKPKYFIWENVKGVLSSNKGFDFARVQDQMAQAGYGLWWQVLNAKDFGVPQNRERVFVVGVRNGSPREILFEREGNEERAWQDGQGDAYCIQAQRDLRRLN